MACRELRAWSLIVSEPVPGQRRMRHQVVTDLGRVIRSIILRRKRREWDPILEQARGWIPRLEGDRSPNAAVFRERLKAIESCLAMADSMVQLFLDGETLPDVQLKKLMGPDTRRESKGQ